MGKILKPKNHWLKCTECKGIGGIKWQDIEQPLCEDCLIKAMDELFNKKQ